jgi:hypothetical protein
MDQEYNNWNDIKKSVSTKSRVFFGKNENPFRGFLGASDKRSIC